MDIRAVTLLAALMCVYACGGDDDAACDPVAGRGCSDGKVCERTTGGGEPLCAPPVVLRGKVFALAGGAGIAGARVVAVDANGAPASTVAVTASGGTYELAIPSERNPDGSLVGGTVTLRADASSYQGFPAGIRQSLPISLGSASATGGKLVVMSALTDVGLIALPGAGTGSIAGKIEVPPSRAGVLVVAEGAGGVASTAIADTGGDYRIVNVAPGSFTVKAYARGVSFTTAQAQVVAGQAASAHLTLADQATASVTGKIEITNPGSGSHTSVILVVESTFSEALGRGESPPGLRAGSVSGDFTIEGVPAGRYVVLAAFENDDLVRDPDTGIGGTAIVRQEVVAGQDVTISESFKVTGALDVIGPGRDGPESVTGTPMLSWVDDSSEEEYRLVVFDALGSPIWDKTVPRETGRNPVIPYEGPALQSGMFYQFRALSMRTKGGAGLRPISATEDLRGVFFVP
jgi:hypothetical protein